MFVYKYTSVRAPRVYGDTRLFICHGNNLFQFRIIYRMTVGVMFFLILDKNSSHDFVINLLKQTIFPFVTLSESINLIYRDNITTRGIGFIHVILKSGIVV